MFRKLFKSWFFLINAAICLAPIILLFYYLYHWALNSGTPGISLVYALYYWFGIDPTIESVRLQMGGFYNLYLFLLKLPLLFWLIIVSIPSVFYIYGFFNNLDR